jgi:hypothetical protein
MIPEIEIDDASSAERDRKSLEAEEEFNKLSKWRQAVLAVVVHGLGRNESALYACNKTYECSSYLL